MKEIKFKIKNKKIGVKIQKPLGNAFSHKYVKNIDLNNFEITLDLSVITSEYFDIDFLDLIFNQLVENKAFDLFVRFAKRSKGVRVEKLFSNNIVSSIFYYCKERKDKGPSPTRG